MSPYQRHGAAPREMIGERNIFERLHERIAHGWQKLNEDASRTLVGSPPHLDLYWGVRSLDRRFPVPAEMSVVFDRLARRVSDLYPERVQTEILTTYDGRIVIFEFNDHPHTTHAEVLRVVAELSKEVVRA